MKMVTESQGQARALLSDIRRVLDDESIDAVVIATPRPLARPPALSSRARRERSFDRLTSATPRDMQIGARLEF